MKLFNQFNKEINVWHIQGMGDLTNELRSDIFRVCSTRKLEYIPDLTIVTVYTDRNLAFIVDQIEAMHDPVPYINAFDPNLYDKWFMPNKIDYIRRALRKVNTKYSLILDAYDVAIYSLSDLISSLSFYNTRILFNATKNRYPNTIVDKIPARDYIGDFNNFNAGCAIGYTSDLIDFYDQCWAIAPDIANIWKSEQLILRYEFSKYSQDCITTPDPYIIFDYKCRSFMCCGVCTNWLDDNGDMHIQ